MKGLTRIFYICKNQSMLIPSSLREQLAVQGIKHGHGLAVSTTCMYVHMSVMVAAEEVRSMENTDAAMKQCGVFTMLRPGGFIHPCCRLLIHLQYHGGAYHINQNPRWRLEKPVFPHVYTACLALITTPPVIGSSLNSISRNSRHHVGVRDCLDVRHRN